MMTLGNLRKAGMNRSRKKIFGDRSLKVYTTTPEAGDTLVQTFADDWRGRRIRATTDAVSNAAGAWQFEIAALTDWQQTQAFMFGVVALKIDAKRWKVTKVEEPIGVSLVWKIRAEMQRQ